MNGFITEITVNSRAYFTTRNFKRIMAIRTSEINIEITNIIFTQYNHLTFKTL